MTHRLRDGNTIAFTYDALNRKATKTPPESANAVAYGYDNLGRLTSENFTNNSALNLTFGYDALGRRTSQTGPLGKVSSLWDLDGRRQQLSWPDGMYIAYTWDNVGEMTGAEENGATSGVGLLASFGYDNLGHRKTLTRGDGVATTYGYDPAGRLTSLVHSGGSSNQGFNPINYDPAGDMVSFTTTNAAYAWAGPAATTSGYQVNGQNQYTSVGSAPFSYDLKGNLTTTSSGGPVFGYDSENRLTSMSGSPGASLAYYPDGSLWQTVGSATTRFLYDGDQIIGEYDGSNNLLRRYVPGPGVDEPLVWYEGSGTTSRRWLLGDHQGSIIAWADSSGSIPAANIDSYDEYGQPGSSNAGRFQYTGQPWIPEVAAYDYRARDYMPSIGRFLQTDPKGYEAGLNLYAYVDDDPVDRVDPTGLYYQSDNFRNLGECQNFICPPEPRGAIEQVSFPYSRPAPIVGNPQEPRGPAGPEHARLSADLAHRLSFLNNVRRVHLNRSLSAITGRKPVSGVDRRPDVTVEYNSGKLVPYEIPSPGQTDAELISRYRGVRLDPRSGYTLDAPIVVPRVFLERVPEKVTRRAAEDDEE